MAGEAPAVGSESLILADVKAPPHTDAFGPWPPDGKLPEGWVQVELGIDGKPIWQDGNPWDPFNPKVGAKGRVVTLGHGEGGGSVIRVLCAPNSWETDWSNICPELPTPYPPPTGPGHPRSITWWGCSAGDFTYSRSLLIKTQKLFIRETDCLLQLTCVIEYEETLQDYRCERVWTGHNKWVIDGDALVETKARTRTTIFQCPC